MERNLSIVVVMTISAFVLTVYLFVVVIVQKDKISVTAVIADMPVQQPEIEFAGEKIFNANCKACHRVHQKLVGPPLAGVLERRDSLWIIKMIRNSSKLIASGDPIAVKLFREYNGTQMTAFPSFTDDELRSLLEYLKHESERENKPLPATPRVEV